jgi:tripeptidyl-peptidase II
MLFVSSMLPIWIHIPIGVYCSYLICCLHPGARLVINPSWKNPSQEWHVGCKLIYELFTDTLTSRLKVNFIFSAYTPKFYIELDILTRVYPPTLQKERKKKWDEENQESISDALKQLNEFEKV